MNQYEPEVSKRPVHVPAVRPKLVHGVSVEFGWSQACHGYCSGDPVDETHATTGQCFDVEQFEPEPFRRREQRRA